MKILILVVFFFYLSVFSLFSQAVKPEAVYFDEIEEVYFSFPLPRSDIFQKLVNKISVDNIIDGNVYAYANAEGFAFFSSLNLYYALLDHPGDVAFDLNMKDLPEMLYKDLSDTWDFYPTYDAYLGMMSKFESEFPELCKIVTIGESVMGRKLLFAKVTANVNQRKAEPRFMFSSTMHGDETTGFILSLRLIHHLLSNYGVDEEISQLLDNVELWICPNENPDGTYTNDNNTVNGARRFNANWVDLNRNYPNPVKEPSESLQPETLAMISFADTMHFVMSANMHTGIECVNYPFDSWTSSMSENLHADHLWWQYVSHEYADTARFYSPSTYMNPSGTSFNRGVTHGGDWYIVYGSRQDYMNYYAATREFTLELSNQKLLAPELLPAHWDYNYRSLLNYIRQAQYGIRGLVTDINTGAPLVATLSIAGHDQRNSEVYSEPLHGSYFRPLLEGTYTVIATAEGYPPVEIQGIVVKNYQFTTVDIKMGIQQGPVAVFGKDTLFLGPAVISAETNAWLEVSNEGNEDLVVQLDQITGDEVFGVSVPAKSLLIIPPDSVAYFPFWFKPNQEGAFNGEAHFSTNDIQKPEVIIPLIGEGFNTAAIIYAQQRVWEFGIVPIGQSSQNVLSIMNSGNLDLDIQEINISNPAFSVDEFLPIILEPGASLEFTVAFNPDAVAVFEASLGFVSNAVNDELQIDLLGTGDFGVLVEVVKSPSEGLLFPNPVNETSVLRFEIAKPGMVEAVLFDSRGTMNQILFQGQKETGIHRLNAGGVFSVLKPGVYFIRLTLPQGTITFPVVKAL